VKTSRGLSPSYRILIGGVRKQDTKKIWENKRGYSRELENLCTFVHNVYTYVQI